MEEPDNTIIDQQQRTEQHRAAQAKQNSPGTDQVAGSTTALPLMQEPPALCQSQVQEEERRSFQAQIIPDCFYLDAQQELPGGSSVNAVQWPIAQDDEPSSASKVRSALRAPAAARV